MDRIKTFLNNYKKILLVGLVALVLGILLSAVANYLVYKYEISSNNRTQLELISEKADEYDVYSDNLAISYNGVIADSAKKIANLLKLEPQDVYNDAIINKCRAFLTDNEQLVILDKNRRVINSGESALNIDYTAACYDKLFTATEDQSVVIDDEENGNGKSTAVRSGDYYVVIQNITIDKTNKYFVDCIWKLSYFMVGVDSSSHFLAVDKSNDTVIYSDIDELVGKQFSSKISSGGSYKYDGEEYAVQSYDKRDDVRLLAITSKNRIVQRCKSNATSLIAVFTLAAIILIAYIVCLREDAINPEEEYTRYGKNFLRSQVKRYKAHSAMVIIAAVALLIGISNLNNERFDEEYLESETAICMESMSFYEDVANYAYDSNCDVQYSTARLVDAFISQHEDYLNKKGLATISNALGVNYISIFNADGSTKCTSSSMDHINILDDEDSSLYELRYALMGKEGVVVSGDSKKMSEDDTFYAVPRRDSDGIADGIIAVAISGVQSDTVGNAGDEILSVGSNVTSSRIAVVDSKGKIILGALGNNSNVTVPKDVLQDGFMGRCIIDKRSYLISSMYNETSNRYLCIGIPLSRINVSTLVRSLISLLLLIMMAIWTGYDGLGSKYHFEKRDKKEKDADEWERTVLLWEELSLNDKMSRIMGILACICGLGFITAWILQREGVVAEYGLGYIMSGNWDKSINGYALFGNICVIVVCYTILRLIKLVITILESVVGEANATGFRLFKSLITYVVVITCAFIVATNFGVDIITAVASIGVIGLALTFGAQELVKDMISGMFILLEGKFKVGDMIDINGNWYWIKSIGVRTTVVEAWGQVRVINNSQMTGIVNIQDASAVVNIDIPIEHDVDVDELQAIIMAELPALKENFPASVSTPTWKGIQDINGSGIVIRLRTYCPPMLQGWVGRTMRKEIKRILDEHDIRPANDTLLIVNEDN